jgi:starch phosphorylase
MPSWDSAAADSLWINACGKGRLLDTMDTINDNFEKVTGESLWQLRMEEAQQLFENVRRRPVRQLARAVVPELLIKQSR